VKDVASLCLVAKSKLVNLNEIKRRSDASEMYNYMKTLINNDMEKQLYLSLDNNRKINEAISHNHIRENFVLLNLL
jgi:hypothetical protein